MKKRLFFIIFLMFIASFNLVAQNNSLYDVNYDKPQNIVKYNEANETFQKIFLQYESAIAAAIDLIRKEEKERYFKEIENIRETEKINTKNAIEKMRREIYGNEIETVRKQEIERLTVELTEKISQELHTKLSSEYEEKKNTEIGQLYEHIKQEAYKEAESASKRNDYIVITLVIVLIMLLIIGLLIWAIQKIKTKQQKKRREKERFETIVQDYLDKLKKHNGDTYPVRKEIDSMYNKDENEKITRKKALTEAENRYIPEIKDIEDYKNDFSGYYNELDDYIKYWQKDKTEKIFKSINSICLNYSLIGNELYHSLEFRREAEKRAAKNLLQQTANVLEKFYNSIDREKVEEEFIKAKQNLVQDFKNLVKKFEEYAK